MRITAFNAIALGSLTANDVLLIESLGLGQTYKLSLSTMANYVMSGAYGTSVFATLTSAQTMTNKKLTTVKLNSDTVMSATSAELNKLAGLATTQAELALLAGKTSVVDLQSAQTLIYKTITNSTLANITMNGTLINVTGAQINTLLGNSTIIATFVEDTENALEVLNLANNERVRTYQKEFGAGSTASYITAAEIKAFLGTTRNISLRSQLEYYSVDGTKYTKIATAFDMNSQSPGGVLCLNDFKLTTVVSTSYFVSVMVVLI